MSNASGGFQTFILKEILQALQPLVDAVNNGPSGITQLTFGLGYNLNGGQVNSIQTSLGTISQDVSDIQKIIDDPTNVTNVISGIRDLMNTIKALNSPPDVLGDRLLDYLLVIYIENYYGGVFGILSLLGIIEEKFIPSTSTSPSYTQRKINWDSFLKLRNPSQLLSKYGWNTPTFDVNDFLSALMKAIQDIGIPAFFKSDPGGGADYLYLGIDNPPSQIGAEISSLPATGAGNDAGLSAVPVGITSIDKSVDLGNGWSIILHVAASIAPKYGLLIRPGNITFGQVDNSSPVSSTNIVATIGISKKNQAGGNILLLGKPDGTSLQANVIGAGIGVHSDNQELDINLDIKGLQLTIDPSDLDGFLKDVFGGNKITLNFTGSMVLSSKTGLHFKGQGGLETTIPIRQTFSMVDIDSVTLGLKISDSGLDLLVGASGSLQLGPLAATVDNIGLKISLSQATQGQQGVFGNFDLTFGFKGPDGLGIAIDCGVVVGGGYLSVDEYTGRYSGALQLQVAGIAVQAFGILDTKSPSGNSDYSFVVVITAQFPPPGIQLGFGLNLSGVGGIAGVNRTIASDVLEQDVKAGTLNNLLFPQDLVKNAPQIISNLGNVFPAEDNHYVFGPLVMLSYGPGSIIIAEIGLVIELDPNIDKLVILGVLNATLPKKDTQIIGINLDVDGIIDFTNKSLSVDASIYNSHVASFSLSGDMALRACGGSNPAFLFSLGGFNSALSDIPPGFPKLQPAMVSLGQSDNPRINFTGHLAITSNVFDVGANVDLYAAAGGFSLEAWAGFAVLIHFHPFHFYTGISAGVSIKQGSTVLLSASLSASLDGPNPWHAKGNVSFTILFIDASIGFDATFGSTTQEPASSDDPLTSLSNALKAALEESKNWSSALPAGESTHVSIRQQQTANPGILLVDPWGSITVRQTAVPLDTNINVYDNAPFSPAANFSISQVTLGNGSSLGASDVLTQQDNFAAANFEQMTDDQKLSRKSFELMDSGVTIKPDETVIQDHNPTPVTYDTKFIYPNNQSEKLLANYTIGSEALLASTNFSSKSQSFIANSGYGKFAYRTDSKIVLAPDSYAVVSSQDLTPRQDIMPSGKTSLTQTQAYQTMNTYVANHPDEKDTIQVVPVMVVNRK